MLCSIIALHGKYTKIWDQYKSTIYIVHLRFISKFSIGPSFVMDRYIRVMFKVMHIVWDQGSKQTFVSTFCIRNRNKSGHTFWSPTKTFAQTFWMRRKILLKHDGCEARLAQIFWMQNITFVQTFWVRTNVLVQTFGVWKIGFVQTFWTWRKACLMRNVCSNTTTCCEACFFLFFFCWYVHVRLRGD